MPLMRAQGFVLRNRPLGEADRLVTCFTLELGKVAGVAKGAGKLRSRFGSSLQPLSLIRLMLFAKENRSLVRIDHTDILTSFQAIRDDWEKVRPALYAVDLIDALVAESDPQPRVFALLGHLLRGVMEGEPSRSYLLLRMFEVRLLRLIGYQPLLDACVVCHRPATEAGAFSPALGGSLCAACEAGARDARRVSATTRRLLQRTATLPWEAVDRLHLSIAQQRELKEVLHDLLNSHVRKEVKSYRFL